MARAVRIHEIVEHADGRVEVRYAIGEPLPAVWLGDGLLYQNRAEMDRLIRTLEDTLTEPQLVTLAMASYRKIDPEYQDTRKAIGHTIRLDTSGSGAVVEAEAGTPPRSAMGGV